MLKYQMFEKYLKSAMFLALYPLAMLASNLHEFIALSQNNESYLIETNAKRTSKFGQRTSF